MKGCAGCSSSRRAGAAQPNPFGRSGLMLPWRLAVAANFFHLPSGSRATSLDRYNACLIRPPVSSIDQPGAAVSIAAICRHSSACRRHSAEFFMPAKRRQAQIRSSFPASWSRISSFSDGSSSLWRTSLSFSPSAHPYSRRQAPQRRPHAAESPPG